MHSTPLSAALQTCSKHAGAIANMPVEVCSSYRCAVNQHSCTAALVRARCIPHGSVLLCKTGTASMQLHQWGKALHTGVQCCNTNELQHWSGQDACTLFSSALQNRVTACLCHCKFHLRSSVLHERVQRTNTNALQHWSGQDAFPTVSVALQNRLTAGTVAMQLHLWGKAVHTGVQ